MHEIEAGRWLEDGGGGGKHPVRDHHAACDEGDRPRVGGAVSKEQVERRAEAGAEKHGRGQHVQPLDG